MLTYKKELTHLYQIDFLTAFGWKSNIGYSIINKFVLNINFILALVNFFQKIYIKVPDKNSITVQERKKETENSQKGLLI